MIFIYFFLFKNVIGFSEIEIVNSKNPNVLKQVIEGDLYVGSGAKLLKKTFGVKSGGICTSCDLWPQISDGTYEIPYKIEDEYTKKELSQIKWAMDYISRVTNLRFVPKTDQFNYIRIFNGEGCYSALGMVGGGQPLSLMRTSKANSAHCLHKHVVLHELLHAVGLGHEHQRPDRDAFLNVLLNNVNSEWRDQLKLLDFLDGGSITDYDYMSIMHYSLRSFANKNGVTLLPRDERYTSYLDKNRLLLTSCDIYELNVIYPGSKLPGQCRPGEIYDAIEPTEHCIRTLSTEACKQICDNNGNNFIENDDREYCQFIGGGRYPPLNMKSALPAEIPKSDIGTPVIGADGQPYCDVPLPLCRQLISESQTNSYSDKLNCEYPCRILCNSSLPCDLPGCYISQIVKKENRLCECINISSRRHYIISNERCQELCALCHQKNSDEFDCIAYEFLCIKENKL